MKPIDALRHAKAGRLEKQLKSDMTPAVRIAPSSTGAKRLNGGFIRDAMLDEGEASLDEGLHPRKAKTTFLPLDVYAYTYKSKPLN